MMIIHLRLGAAPCRFPPGEIASPFLNECRMARATDADGSSSVNGSRGTRHRHDIRLGGNEVGKSSDDGKFRREAGTAAAGVCRAPPRGTARNSNLLTFLIVLCMFLVRSRLNGSNRYGPAAGT